MNIKEINKYILEICSHDLKYFGLLGSDNTCDDFINVINCHMCPMGTMNDDKVPETYVDDVYKIYLEHFNNSPDRSGECVSSSWCFRRVCYYGLMLGFSPLKTFELLVGFSTDNEIDKELGFAICPCMRTISETDRKKRFKQFRDELFKPLIMETE